MRLTSILPRKRWKMKTSKVESLFPDVTALWGEEKITAFQTEFLEWYERTRRDLPWRENSDPYRVWVSEIMLQQTQVVTVIPYFYRFMEWFPTISDLAEAEEEKLLKAWEGLGYYSRVRNMQKAAQQLVADHNGQMPNTIEEISELKGIGPYTAGAISSIAFGLPEPAIDGNVMRVFSRLFELDADIAKPSSRKVFDHVVRQVMPHQDPSSFNQAIMDLGATVCMPKTPTCESCPLSTYCQSYEKGTMLNFPVKSKKVKSKPVYYVAHVIKNNSGEYVLEQRPETGLLANLWTFPLIEVTKEAYDKLNVEDTKEFAQLELIAEDSPSYISVLKEQETCPTVWQTKPVGEVTHIFSHLKWHISIGYGQVERADYSLTDRQKWVPADQFSEYPFPKPQQKMVEVLSGTGYL